MAVLRIKWKGRTCVKHQQEVGLTGPGFLRQPCVDPKTPGREGSISQFRGVFNCRAGADPRLTPNVINPGTEETREEHEQL